VRIIQQKIMTPDNPTFANSKDLLDYLIEQEIKWRSLLDKLEGVGFLWDERQFDLPDLCPAILHLMGYSTSEARTDAVWEELERRLISHKTSR